jgi:predicted SprT family Zn-dependent metalloprotease
MQTQFQQIRDRVRDCINMAETKFGIKMPEVKVLFDLRGRAAGMAQRRGTEHSLRFNVEHIRLGGKTWEHLLNETVPHEVAHAVCHAHPRFGHRHDAGWQRVCRTLGGNGSQCYGEEDAPEAVAAQRPWVYITTAGYEVRVTKIIHRKIQSGAAYVMRGGRGRVTRECQYNYMAPPLQAQTPQPERTSTLATVNPATHSTPASGATMASLIRARIQQAKARAESEDVVIQFGVEVLGMKAALARTYTRNNWNKV